MFDRKPFGKAFPGGINLWITRWMKIFVASPGRGSDIQVSDRQGIALDEVTPRFDLVTHQGREYLV
jgi:hypothetical protein